MADSTDNRFPKLRALDFRPMVQNGQSVLLLRDPLQVSEQMVAIPQQLAPVLALCDGTRDRAALRAALIVRYQMLIGTEILNQLLDACDEAYLFDNERYREAYARTLATYRQAPCRPAALAGQSYPSEPTELRALLDGYLAEANGAAAESATFGNWRGLVSPHIDYQRGGPVYAAVWARAAEMVRSADLAIILGTDHYSGRRLLTLTRQNYATPYGILPTDTVLVDRLAKVIGSEAAFAGELNHRNEHSIELAAVWLHHMRGGRPCQVVPILCGSYASFVEDEANIDAPSALTALVSTLQRHMPGQRTIVIAAGDLSHVGPAFGGDAVDPIGCARLRLADEEIMAQVCAGDAEGFFNALKRVGDRNNVCGLPPIHLALRLLQPTQGVQVGYDRCSADEQDTSYVSIAGIVLQ